MDRQHREHDERYVRESWVSRTTFTRPPAEV